MNKKLKQFTVRLSEDDHIKLVYQAEKLNISQAEFLREMIRKGLLDDIKEYNILLDDLRKSTRNLSNNINQIAKKINSNILINELQEAEKLHGEITKIWQLLKSGKTYKSLKKVLNYVGEKACETYGINCNDSYKKVAYEFFETKDYFQKTNGRQYRHYIQSFSPSEVSKEKILEIAVKWAEKSFPGHEIFIAVHDDKEHLHSHFIINTVNFETGEKLHETACNLAFKKSLNDEIF